MRRLVIVAVSACTLWAVPVAEAGTIQVTEGWSEWQGHALSWLGEPGEDNDIVVETGPDDTIVLTERGADARLAVRPGGLLPCDVRDRVATCGPGHISDFGLHADDGDDRISTEGLREDPSRGRYFVDWLYGEDGNDVLDGADHTCCTGARLVPGRGDDFVKGGASDGDEVLYYDRDESLDISLEPRPPGARNGAVGEHDVIADDVESLHGGWGDDVLYGDENRNVLRTSTGSDRVYGGGGNDVLWASSGYSNGPDEMHGEEGDDFFFTGPLPGLVDGGPGDDAVDVEGEAWYSSLTLDGMANDGGIVPRQPDPWSRAGRVPDGDLRDVESIWGGELSDFIAGDAADNKLFGMSGSDVIVAGAGSDEVYDDADYYSRGDDFIVVLDGERDTVYCSNGIDTIVADTFDRLANDECEHVTYEEVPIPGIELPKLEPPLPDPLPVPLPDPPLDPPVELPPGLPLPDPWPSPAPPAPPGQPGQSPRPPCPVLATTRQARITVGGPAAECFVGGRGNDRLKGNAGDDQLMGGAGRDRLTGGPGDDWVDGGPGADRLDGGPQDDLVLGGLGSDSLTAGSGDDLVVASDGARDTIDCGEGRDVAVADRVDRVKGCEVVRRTRRPSRR